MEDVMKHMAASANKIIGKRDEQIKAQQELLESMGETNRVMGQRLLKFEAALKEIAQQTGSGNYLNDMLDMKLTATNALKLPS